MWQSLSVDGWGTVDEAAELLGIASNVLHWRVFGRGKNPFSIITIDDIRRIDMSYVIRLAAIRNPGLHPHFGAEDVPDFKDQADGWWSLKQFGALLGISRQRTRLFVVEHRIPEEGVRRLGVKAGSVGAQLVVSTPEVQKFKTVYDQQRAQREARRVTRSG